MSETNRGTPVMNGLLGSHYKCLDGLRGLAILMVMCYHFGLAFKDIHDNSVAMQLAQFGWLGVDLFFVLSGFLITGILIETKSSQHYFRNFLMRRFLRIWPLYYLSLAAFFIVAPIVLRELPEQLAVMNDKQGWFWLYAANWLFASEGGFEKTPGGYYWSLAVEEQFYLIWPFVVYRLKGSSLLKLCGAIFVGSFILRHWLIAEGTSINSVYTMTITHMDGLALGAALAVCLRSETLMRHAVKMLPYVAIASAIGLIFVRVNDQSGFFWEPNMAKYGYSVSALLFGSLLVFTLRAQQGSALNRLFEGGFLRVLGKYSYALYLLHVPVAVAMEKLLLARLEQTSAYWIAYPSYVTVTFAVSLALSMLSWALFERHVLGLKKYFAY